MTAKKSLNITSATGRKPVIAAPMRAPDDRLLGDRRVADALRSELLEQAGVSLNTPPAAATSSPRNTTVSSRSISWAIAAATAAR